MKYGDVLKAWIDGQKVQYQTRGRQTWFNWESEEEIPTVTDGDSWRVKPQEKPLWQVAYETWGACREGREAAWKASTDAVIAAYKERA